MDRIAEYEQSYNKRDADFNLLQQSIRNCYVSTAHSVLLWMKKQLHFNEQLRQLAESREMLKREFENLANEILERKGKAFKELNQESIYHLLRPVQAENAGLPPKSGEYPR